MKKEGLASLPQLSIRRSPGTCWLESNQHARLRISRSSTLQGEIYLGEGGKGGTGIGLPLTNRPAAPPCARDDGIRNWEEEKNQKRT